MEAHMPDKSWMPAAWGGREIDPFRGFRNQLDTLFEDWFGRSMGGTLAPRVDVSETSREVTLKVELPGVEEKDIDVAVSGNRLTIKGEKKAEAEQTEGQESEGRVFHRVERSFGAFQRTMTVPFDVQPDKVSAAFKDGVLTITLPKPEGGPEQAQTHHIEVKRAQ
jgi:HSP20 family protein